jgi:hypothetical protein
MNRISLMFFILIALGCNSKKRTNVKLPPRSIEVNNLIDKEIYTVLQYNVGDSIFKNAVSSELTTRELSDIQRILEDAIAKVNLARKTKFDLNKYKRQYIAVINKNGEKEVWVNCFCQYDETWTRNVVVVLDGGNCYFNLKINLSKNKYYDFYVNGMA